MEARVVGLAIVVVVLVAGLAVLGSMYSALSSRYSSLKSSYESLKSSYGSLESSYSSLNSSYISLKGEYSALQGSYSALESMYKNQQADVVLAAAMSHWNDIAIENVSLVAPEYAPNATLHWVGGPLSGNYTGISAIEGVWDKFFNLYETVYWYTIVPPTVMPMGPGTYQVTGYVQFLVAPTAQPINVLVLNVTEMLTYVNTSSGYLITNEVWEVKPLPLTDVIAGYPGQQALASDAVLAAAMSHWNDIAIESAPLVIAEYAPSAVLHWIGGPLSGTYSGIAAINSTWDKFFNLYETVYWYTIVPPTVTEITPVEYNVTGYAQFFVAPTADPLHIMVLNVTEVLTYVYNSSAKQFQITNEVWKVKPISVSDVIAGYPPQSYVEEQMVLAQAYAHWNDIAIENASLIISEYAPNATLHWVGGPLSGNYTGISAINATWNKFDNTYEYVVWYALVPPNVTLKGTMAKVEAPLQFVVFPFPTSSNPHPVEFVLNVTEILYYSYNTTAMQWQIVNEYWIVHPLQISAVAPGYSPGQYQG